MGSRGSGVLSSSSGAVTGFTISPYEWEMTIPTLWQTVKGCLGLLFRVGKYLTYMIRRFHERYWSVIPAFGNSENTELRDPTGYGYKRKYLMKETAFKNAQNSRDAFLPLIAKVFYCIYWARRYGTTLKGSTFYPFGWETVLNEDLQNLRTGDRINSMVLQR